MSSAVSWLVPGFYILLFKSELPEKPNMAIWGQTSTTQQFGKKLMRVWG